MDKVNQMPNPNPKPDWVKTKAIFKRLLMSRITIEEALNLLAQAGYSPNLLYNRDDMTWALIPESVFQVYEKHQHVDVSFYVFTNSSNFKSSIRDAILHFLWPSVDYTDSEISVSAEGSYVLIP